MMTEQDSTKLLFLFEQYRPEPHAVKATEPEMRNLPSNLHAPGMTPDRTRHALASVISQVLMVTGKPQFKSCSSRQT